LWGKKDKHCDADAPADRDRGSQWDHVLLDADSKLIVTLVVGRRTEATAYQAFADFYERTDEQLPPLITTDEYAVYFSVIVSIYGVRKEELELTDTERAAVGWEELPASYFPEEISYATVHKDREQGRVVRVQQRVIKGTLEQVQRVLEQGSTARTINTNYIERWNGTQRNFNPRKGRKVYTFSKDLVFHVAVTWLCVVAYNFCWTPHPLREKIQEDPPRYRYRTPAMAAGLSKAVWTVGEVLRYPIYRSETSAKSRKVKRRRSMG